MWNAIGRQSLVTQFLLLVSVPAAIVVLIVTFLSWRAVGTALAGVVLLTGAAVWTLLTAVGVLMLRRVAATLGQLESLATRVARGEAPATVVHAFSGAETRNTVTAVLNMAKTLDAQRSDLKHANFGLNERVQERTREIDLLVGLYNNLADGEDPLALMNDILVELRNAVSYSAASIWMRERDRSVSLRAFHSQGVADNGKALHGVRLSDSDARLYTLIEHRPQPVVVNQSKRNLLAWLLAQLVEGNPGSLYRSSRSWMATPLLVHNNMIGVLRVDQNEQNFFTPERERLLVAVARQAALAIEHARLSAQAEQAAVAAERSRIARDLHDAVSQSLFAASMTADSVAKSLGPESAPVAEQLRMLQQLNRGALSEMRVLLFELRPDALRQAPLGELLRHLAESMSSRAGISVGLSVQGDGVLPLPVKEQMYRIAQEALGNMARHSHASEASVAIRNDGDAFCELVVKDNGIGFDPAVGKPGHLGLQTMRERAEEIGANLDIASEIGKGTTLTAVWELETSD
jgi:signal transduction histidine kinase